MSLDEYMRRDQTKLRKNKKQRRNFKAPQCMAELACKKISSTKRKRSPSTKSPSQSPSPPPPPPPPPPASRKSRDQDDEEIIVKKQPGDKAHRSIPVADKKGVEKQKTSEKPLPTQLSKFHKARMIQKLQLER
ncbi:hypothetical protein BST61_g4169 [Cercospora zeina]